MNGCWTDHSKRTSPSLTPSPPAKDTEVSEGDFYMCLCVCAKKNGQIVGKPASFRSHHPCLVRPWLRACVCVSASER